MFPIPWNKAYRKKDGTIVNIDDAMGGGGGGSELPDYGIEDAGKVLGVDENGELAWVTVSGGSNFGSVSVKFEAPVIKPEVKEGTT